jgi:hypothetical protein
MLTLFGFGVFASSAADASPLKLCAEYKHTFISDHEHYWRLELRRGEVCVVTWETILEDLEINPENLSLPAGSELMLTSGGIVFTGTGKFEAEVKYKSYSVVISSAALQV